MSKLSLFAAPSVDRVLNLFHKALAELEGVVDHHTKKAADHGAEIVFHSAAQAKSEDEAARAGRVIDKLVDLLK